MADYPAPAEKEKAGGKSASDFMATARKRFQRAIDATTDNRTDQLDDVRFAAANPDNQWQWPQEVLTARQNTPGQPPRPTLTINKLPQHIRLVTNEQRQNRPSIKVLPVDDKGDVEVAEILNGMVRHIESISDADIAYDTAGECQVTSGEGYWRVLTDYVDEMSVDEQDILIAPIRNPFSVYLDPDGLRRDSTGRYCEWGFITDELTKDEFTRQFPKAKEIDWTLSGMGDDEKAWFEGSKVRIAEYFCFEYEKATIVKWSDGSVTIKGQMPKVAGMAPMMKNGKPVERETQIRKVMWSKINGLEPLEEREWAGKFIPIVRVAGNEWEVEGKQVVSGIVRNAKDAQRMVNYWTSQEAEMLALAPKAPFLGTFEQFENFESDWQNANVTNAAFLKYNHQEGVPPPTRQMPPMPPAGFINAKLGAADDLQSAVGQYNPSLGAEAKEKSGKAIVARQKQADVGTFHYIDNQGRAIRQTGRILIDLIPKIYDTKRVARVIGEDGEPDTVTIDPDQSEAKMEIPDEAGGIEKIYNPSIGQYDVRVTVGPSYTTKRQEAAEFMAQVLQGNKELMQVMGDLYFKMLDVPGAEEISERLKKTLPPNLAADDDEGQEQVIQTPEGPLPISQAGAAIGQLHQQVVQMSEALQSAEVQGKQAKALDAQNKGRELDIKRAQVEIERFNAMTERLKVSGGQAVDEVEHALEEAEMLLTHDREVHGMNQAGEMHDNDNALRQQEVEAQAKAAAQPTESGVTA